MRNDKVGALYSPTGTLCYTLHVGRVWSRLKLWQRLLIILTLIALLGILVPVFLLRETPEYSSAEVCLVAKEYLALHDMSATSVGAKYTGDRLWEVTVKGTTDNGTFSHSFTLNENTGAITFCSPSEYRRLSAQMSFLLPIPDPRVKLMLDLRMSQGELEEYQLHGEKYLEELIKSKYPFLKRVEIAELLLGRKSLQAVLIAHSSGVEQ